MLDLILYVVALIAFGIAAFGHLFKITWDFPLVPLGLFCWLLANLV